MCNYSFLLSNAHMQHSFLTRQSGHTVHPDKVCLTVSCMHKHPVQGLASLRTLDYNMYRCNEHSAEHVAFSMCPGASRPTNEALQRTFSETMQLLSLRLFRSMPILPCSETDHSRGLHDNRRCQRGAETLDVIKFKQKTCSCWSQAYRAVSRDARVNSACASCTLYISIN